MNRFASAALLVAACAVLSSASIAQAAACRDGRAASSRCVKPRLVTGATERGAIHAQPKLSYTHYPVLPTLDWDYRYPNALNPNPLKPAPTKH